MRRVSVFDPLKAWIRRVARRYTRPISVDEAAEKKEMYSIIYILSAFTLFCYSSYKAISGAESMSSLSERDRMRSYARSNRNDEEIRIIRFNNFTKTEEVYLSKEEVAKLRHEKRDSESS